MLKRFEDNELGESISRRVAYHCTTEYAKSSKATCRGCHTNIEQNELRLALMLQDEEGYKNTAWMHFNCFWKHPETKKLDGIHEIHNFSKLKPTDQEKISTAFENLNVNKSTTKRKRKVSSKQNDNDEDFIPKSKLNAKKSTTSTKRKRDLEED